jgi:YfiH family protein
MEARDLPVADGVLVPLLQSSTIPASFRHGFSTRAGGVSPAPYHSLNLGSKWGDSPENVAENRRRLLAASGARAMVRVSQKHGTHVVRVTAGDDPETVKGMEADGLCSDEAGLGLSVHVADCVPVLIADPRTGACAALHAGWRGTVAGVTMAGVKALADGFGCRPEDLRVALGPCIGPCCFDVGAEVVAAFEAAWPGAHAADIVVERSGFQPRIDLRQCLRLQFQAAGVLPESIDASADCTNCDPAGRFYSFRHSGRLTGQLVGFIVAPGGS